MLTSRRTLPLRRFIRNAANAEHHLPVEIIDGDAPPTVTGERGGHFTRGGQRIHHPSAYGRVGWSNMVYRSSTLAVTVGRTWLTTNADLTELVRELLIGV